MNEEGVTYRHKMKYYSSHGKEGNPDICSNMDELWGCYAKWIS